MAIDRKTFLKTTLAGAGCCLVAAAAPGACADLAAQASSPDDADKTFIKNFLSDLLESIDRELPEDLKSKVVGGCGRACFQRFDFKRQWAIDGKGDADRLIAALQKNFLVERQGQLVHVRYGAISKGCYCPAAKYRAPKPNDIHCYCSRATHQAVWETALGRPIRVDLAESVRRVPPSCGQAVYGLRTTVYGPSAIPFPVPSPNLI
jgi:hypothetical protein